MAEVTDALLGEVIAWVRRGRVIVHDPDIDHETLERRSSALLALALEVRRLREENELVKQERDGALKAARGAFERGRDAGYRMAVSGGS